MYNDGRVGEEAKFIETLTHEHSDKLGYAFAPSFSLPKMLWLKRNEPQIYERTARFLHAGDYIIHKLTGEVYSDPSTSLKTGYDPLSEEWPEFIERDLGIERDKLPPVKKSGTIIGTITKETAQETGLPEGIPVCLGTTDGVASLIASGASSPGDWCSTLGTTLVVRGISEELVRDPLGRVYSHRHPDGWWMPGGASNIGGECLQKWFAGEDFAALDEQAQELLPIQILSYPLARKGERLPFLSADAEGFFEPVPQTLLSYYAACLQGVALTERWIWDLTHELGASVGSTVFAAGGGCKSALWMQLRADVTQKTLLVAAYPEAAAGAAILSASTHFGTLHTATKSMTQITQTYTPASNFYDELYTRFREVCAAVYSL
jgi:xylulokinase